MTSLVLAKQCQANEMLFLHEHTILMFLAYLS